MKIALLSDLHIEAHEDSPRLDLPEDVDVLLLAGDVMEGVGCREWAERWHQQTGVRVGFVLGNHEYYGHEIGQLERACREGLPSDVQMLQCNEIQLDGYLILGATLWTDFALYGDVAVAQEAAALYMLDYGAIRIGERALTPADTVRLHEEQRGWLQARLEWACAEGLKAIVMTHHAPTAKSIAPRYGGSKATPAFASDLSDWMFKAWSPVLWVHGHTHYPVDYVMGFTRIVSHPRGYPGEGGLDDRYQWGKIVSLP